MGLLSAIVKIDAMESKDRGKKEGHENYILSMRIPQENRPI